jgi:hypothetical protein
MISKSLTETAWKSVESLSQCPLLFLGRTSESDLWYIILLKGIILMNKTQKENLILFYNHHLKLPCCLTDIERFLLSSWAGLPIKIAHWERLLTLGLTSLAQSFA